MPDSRDVELRQTAFARVRELQLLYGLSPIPVTELRRGFVFRGERVSFGSFYKGIFRPKEMSGSGALVLVTAAPKSNRPAPYEDEWDPDTETFTYRFRDPLAQTGAALRQAEADNRALLAAHRDEEPLIYFRGILPGQYEPVAPVFIESIDERARLVRLKAGLPLADTDGRGFVSEPDVRAWATQEAAVRLHQSRFRAAVLRAYAESCAICTLKETQLLEASHIIRDRAPQGHATVVNGIALCAIHHLAYDRNLMGIDADGVVHTSHALLEKTDGPMLKMGLQGFHGAAILQPRRTDERPDPARLDLRFSEFLAAAAQ